MADSGWRMEIPGGKKPVLAEFSGGALSSDGGMLLLEQVDRQLGLTARLAGCLRDERDPDRIEQPGLVMLRQRIFGIACGYEDCNDFDTLRAEPLFKLAAGRTPGGADLASQPTLSRWENSATRAALWRMSEVLLGVFLEGHREN